MSLDHMSVSERVGERLEGRRGGERRGEKRREKEKSVRMMTVELSIAAVCSVYLCTTFVTCENCQAAPQPLTAVW